MLTGIRRPLPQPTREAGPPPEAELGDRVAVIASWGTTGRASRSVRALVSECDRLGYRSLLVSADETPAPLHWADRPESATVLRRANRGHDFGSWATTLAQYPLLAERPRVLLINDSMLGPFAPLDDVVGHFESTDCDVWGLVDTVQIAPHVQSHFMGYHDGWLARPEMRDWWSRVRHVRAKDALVARYEIGLSRRLHQMGARIAVRFPWQDVVRAGDNPTGHGWRRLAMRGFPFLKRIVHDNPQDFADSGDFASVFRELYGVDLREWAEDR